MRTDSDRLTQVLINLLSNAFKFSYQGNVTLEAKMERKHIRITVKDTGIGMDQETMYKLANIPNKALSGEKVNCTSTGVGLGLTVSQAIVMMLSPVNMSGLYFESRVNYGSTFTFLVEDKHLDSETEIDFGACKTPSLKFIGKGLEMTTPPKLRIIQNKSFEHLSLQKSHIQTISDSFEEDSRIFSEMKQSEIPKSAVPFFSLSKSRDQIYEPNLNASQFNMRLNLSEPEEAGILIVDDEPINILALEMLFKQLNKKVDKAYGAEEALRLIEERAFKSRSSTAKIYKLILMDLNMPLIDGYEATRRIKQKVRNNIIQDVKIVACTAYQEHEHKLKCIEVGMCGFINKPVTKIKLMELLKECECL